MFIAEYGQCQRKGQKLLSGEGIGSGNIFPSLFIPVGFVLLDEPHSIIPHQFHE